jgi:hypothetical protein
LLTIQSESLIAAKEFPEISRKIPVRAASNHDFTANRNHLAFEAAYAAKPLDSHVRSMRASANGDKYFFLSNEVKQKWRAKLDKVRAEGGNGGSSSIEIQRQTG